MPSEESDIEMQSALPKKITKKIPKSPSEEMFEKVQEPKKLTTKDMIKQALVDLKSRKGTSLYAIKKYIELKYKVDVEKLNYIIKKTIKTGVEAGLIVQTKGVGASGSFKLAPGKNKPEKKDKPKKSVEKTTKPKSDKPKKKSNKKNEEKKPKKTIENKPGTSGEIKKKEKSKKDVEKPTENEAKPKKTKVTKTTKALQTPAKKSAMMKRKSIGSIIKPPKMKPRKG